MAYEPTPEEAEAMDKIARAMEPEAWAEYYAGNGTCTNQAGFACIGSIRSAQRLIRAYPAVVRTIA
jgi:hypothetical protein